MFAIFAPNPPHQRSRMWSQRLAPRVRLFQLRRDNVRAFKIEWRQAWKPHNRRGIKSRRPLFLHRWQKHTAASRGACGGASHSSRLPFLILHVIRAPADSLQSTGKNVSRGCGDGAQCARERRPIRPSDGPTNAQPLRRRGPYLPWRNNQSKAAIAAKAIATPRNIAEGCPSLLKKVLLWMVISTATRSMKTSC